MTLYRHFTLEGRPRTHISSRSASERWTRRLAPAPRPRAAASTRGRAAPRHLRRLRRLVRTSPSFEGCSFINVLLEIDDPPSRPCTPAATRSLASIRALPPDRSPNRRASTDAETFSHQWHILMKGSIVSACEGHLDAARCAKPVAELLLATELARASR